jgi:hypothetical protein
MTVTELLLKNVPEHLGRAVEDAGGEVHLDPSTSPSYDRQVG